MAADLVLRNARLVVTMDGARRELAGGWVAVTGGLVQAVGSSLDEPPAAAEVVDVGDCLVTPGLINTHHHLYQNLTRAYPPMTDKPLFGWLQSLYPLWRGLDEESVYASAFVGLAELALSGCTTSTDHLYVHPHGSGDLLGAEIAAARELGVRFHPTTRFDVARRVRRRVAARRRRRRRRRDPRRQRGRRRRPSRSRARGDGAHRPRAVQPVHASPRR